MTFALYIARRAAGIFVDIPLEQQDYDETRDCSASGEGDCVVHAIERATSALKDPTTLGEDRAMALKFLVHFVGDIHQPLYAVKEFKGYNLLAVCFFIPREEQLRANQSVRRLGFWPDPLPLLRLGRLC